MLPSFPRTGELLKTLLDTRQRGLAVKLVICHVSLSILSTLARYEESLSLESAPAIQNAFRYNMMVNTSAEDPELERYLWKGVREETSGP